MTLYGKGRHFNFGNLYTNIIRSLIDLGRMSVCMFVGQIVVSFSSFWSAITQCR